MSTAPAPLTTTAAALLALLLPGPLGSSVLIARYHERFGEVWPRTTALVYEQARRLTRLGLVTMDGRGPVRACTLTDRGRDAIVAWHATAPSAPRIDIELAVRLVATEDLDRERPAIATVGGWADGHIARLDERVANDSLPIGQAIATELLRGIYLSICDWADRSA